MVHFLHRLAYRTSWLFLMSAQATGQLALRRLFLVWVTSYPSGMLYISITRLIYRNNMVSARSASPVDRALGSGSDSPGSRRSGARYLTSRQRWPCPLMWAPYAFDAKFCRQPGINPCPDLGDATLRLFSWLHATVFTIEVRFFV